MVGLSLCFLCVLFSDVLIRVWGLFFLFFSFLSTMDKIKANMLEFPASLGKKSTGKISNASAELLALVLLRKSCVLESSHSLGICVSSPGQLSVLDSQANQTRSGQAVHANLSW